MLEYGNSKSAPIDRVSAGPFDSSEVIQLKPSVDFGALQIPIREDVTLKLEVEEASSRIVALTVDHQARDSSSARRVDSVSERQNRNGRWSIRPRAQRTNTNPRRWFQTRKIHRC